MAVDKHTLYVVSTPIGNRDDISVRALATLQAVDRICCEDTRHSGRLLRELGVETPLIALHEHNEAARVDGLLAELTAGASLALISDAGTPLISDPGYRLVRAALQAGITVSPVPGASALLAALAVAGLPTDRFLFVGFPPARDTARRRWLEALVPIEETFIVYESPHRLLDTLTAMQAVFGAEREVTLARELTKRFETVRHGTLASLQQQVADDTQQQRGEIVLVVAGANRSGPASPPGTDGEAETQPIEVDHLLGTLLGQGVPAKTAAKCAAQLYGSTRQVMYRRCLTLQSAARE